MAEALLARRLNDDQLISLSESEEVVVSPSFINCAEYQLFLDGQQGDDAEQVAAPDHWKEAYFRSGHGQQPILGLRPSDASAFCAWLATRDGGAWHYRLPTRGEQDAVKRALLDDAEKLPPSCGFWVDRTRLAWVKEVGPKLAEGRIHERFARDHDQLANAHQNTELGDIAACLEGIQGLALARSHHVDLANALMAIRDRLSERERSLRSMYEEAKAQVVRIESNHKHVQNEQTSKRAELAAIMRGSLRSEQIENSMYSTIELDFHNEQREKIDRLTAQRPQVKEELAKVKRELDAVQVDIESQERRWFPNKQSLKQLQARRTELSNQQKKMWDQFDQIEQEIEQLKKQEQEEFAKQQKRVSKPSRFRIIQEVDYTRKESIETQLARLDEEEKAINAELEQAQGQQKALGAQITQLIALIRSLSQSCEHVFAFAFTYNSNQTLTNALAFHRQHPNVALNFDLFPVRLVLGIGPDALAYVGEQVRAYIRKVSTDVTQFTRSASGTIDNHDHARLNELSYELASMLEHATLQRYVDSLVTTLHRFLVELVTQRPLGRASPLLRVAIRYCAWELAEYLSYWLENAQVPYRKGVQEVLVAYLDIAITLALLEERIEGKLLPVEGIVLVRERSGPI